jgi:hypothetical protein
MVPLDFDQTNGKVHGLRGDDDGGIAPPVPERSVKSFLQHLLGVRPAPRGTSVVDRDPSVTAYGEEGTP